MIWSTLHTFTYALVALMVIVDPVGTAVVFAAMTPQDTSAERASQARRACLVAWLVLAAFGLAGARLLEAMGIGLPAMRIAGGALLFLTAIEMVADRHALRSTDSERQAALRTDQDIAIFPLAIPLIAGPGAMTTMVVLHSRAGGSAWDIGAIEAAAAITVLATLAALLAARFLTRIMGESGASVAGRVLGVLLAALAVQLAIDGLHEAFPIAGLAHL
jgi:multiple antibiotic resistance protein